MGAIPPLSSTSFYPPASGGAGDVAAVAPAPETFAFGLSKELFRELALIRERVQFGRRLTLIDLLIYDATFLLDQTEILLKERPFDDSEDFINLIQTFRHQIFEIYIISYHANYTDEIISLRSDMEERRKYFPTFNLVKMKLETAKSALEKLKGDIEKCLSDKSRKYKSAGKDKLVKLYEANKETFLRHVTNLEKNLHIYLAALEGSSDKRELFFPLCRKVGESEKDDPLTREKAIEKLTYILQLHAKMALYYHDKLKFESITYYKECLEALEVYKNEPTKENYIKLQRTVLTLCDQCREKQQNYLWQYKNLKSSPKDPKDQHTALAFYLGHICLNGLLLEDFFSYFTAYSILIVGLESATYCNKHIGELLVTEMPSFCLEAEKFEDFVTSFCSPSNKRSQTVKAMLEEVKMGSSFELFCESFQEIGNRIQQMKTRLQSTMELMASEGVDLMGLFSGYILHFVQLRRYWNSQIQEIKQWRTRLELQAVAILEALKREKVDKTTLKNFEGFFSKLNGIFQPILFSTNFMQLCLDGVLVDNLRSKDPNILLHFNLALFKDIPREKQIAVLSGVLQTTPFKINWKAHFPEKEVRTVSIAAGAAGSEEVLEDLEEAGDVEMDSKAFIDLVEEEQTKEARPDRASFRGRGNRKLRKLIQELMARGFIEKRHKKGSHVVYKREEDGCVLVIPGHGGGATLARGTLEQILKAAKL